MLLVDMLEENTDKRPFSLPSQQRMNHDFPVNEAPKDEAMAKIFCKLSNNAGGLSCNEARIHEAD